MNTVVKNLRQIRNFFIFRVYVFSFKLFSEYHRFTGNILQSGIKKMGKFLYHCTVFHKRSW